MKKKLVKFSKEYNILSLKNIFLNNFIKSKVTLKKSLTKTINYYNKYN